MNKIDEFFSDLTENEKLYLFKKVRELKTNANRKRTKQVKFFVDDEELEKINQKIELSGFTKSDYLRASALDKEILKIDGLRELFIEIKKQGTNLNQVVKAINSGNVSNIENLEELKLEYQKINNVLSELIKQVRDE